MLHARDNTPEPITPVTMCVTAVHTVPVLLTSPESAFCKNGALSPASLMAASF
uniref:Uncharacterized protein n=1 Tax=Lotus japonicus TaxID=34305 RepID=I3SNE0_LOTJA|nr:unknown [Lotus japonicus]